MSIVEIFAHQNYLYGFHKNERNDERNPLAWRNRKILIFNY